MTTQLMLSRHDASRVFAGEAVDDLDPAAVREAKVSQAPRYLSGYVADLGATAHAAAKGDRVITFVASDEKVNRSGDIVKVSGWDLENFKKNPIILWNHNLGANPEPPIGRAVSIKKGRNKAGEPALMVDIEFADAETNPMADRIFRLVDGGFLNAVSVGFIPKRVTVPKTDDEAEKMGLGSFGVRIDAAELLEISVVDVPRLPSAVRDSMRAVAERGLLDDAEADALCAALSSAEGAHDAAYEVSVRHGMGDEMADAVAEMFGEGTHDSDQDPQPQDSGGASAADLTESIRSVIADAMQDATAPIQAGANVSAATTVALLQSVTDQTTALRQLLDAVTDMARRVVDLSGESHGGAPVPGAPKAVSPEGEPAPGLSDLDADRIGDAIARALSASAPSPSDPKGT